MSENSNFKKSSSFTQRRAMRQAQKATERSERSERGKRVPNPNRHPSHLRGREIGLFYARRNRNNRSPSIPKLKPVSIIYMN